MKQIDKRNHKVKCDFGMNDYTRYYISTTDNPKSPKIFRAVVNDYLKKNQVLISTKGYPFKLPEQCGRIEVRKSKREVYIDEEGKVINKLPINWKATNKLWQENAEAKKKKIRIRYTNEHTGGYIFIPYFIKRHATFVNKGLYQMRLNREMSRNMYDPIMSKQLDAFLLYANK